MRVLGFAAILFSSVAVAQCTRDTDCKGNRICEAGSCIGSDVPAIEAPPIAVPPPPVHQISSARLIALETELGDLRSELNDATLVGPVIKLVGAHLLAAGGVVFLSLAQTAPTTDLRANDTTFGLIFTGVAVGLVVWGAIQLGLRLHARATLPSRISAIEGKLEDARR